MKLSECATNYARTLANPFDGPLSCIPTFPALQSLKARTYARGVFATSSTTGVGYVVVSPLRCCVNDQSAIFFTLSTFTGTNITASLGVGINPADTNASYPGADLNLTESGFGARVVGLGLRVRYIGTELNRGGQLYALQDPTHSSLDGRSIAELANELQTRVFPVNRVWTTVLYKPVSSGDMNFNQGLPGITQDYYLAILAFISSTTSLSFEWEVYGVFEYQGVNIRGQTASHTDPTGFAAVHSSSAVSSVLNATQLSSDKRETNAIAATVNYLANGISSATSNIKQITDSMRKLTTNATTAYNMALPFAELI